MNNIGVNCNTLQHNATHCNTLQYSVDESNTVVNNIGVNRQPAILPLCLYNASVLFNAIEVNYPLHLSPIQLFPLALSMEQVHTAIVKVSLMCYMTYLYMCLIHVLHDLFNIYHVTFICNASKSTAHCTSLRIYCTPTICVIFICDMVHDPFIYVMSHLYMSCHIYM